MEKEVTLAYESELGEKKERDLRRINISSADHGTGSKQR